MQTTAIGILIVVIMAFLLLSIVGWAECYSDNRDDGRSILSTLVDCG